MIAKWSLSVQEQYISGYYMLGTNIERGHLPFSQNHLETECWIKRIFCLIQQVYLTSLPYLKA